MLTQATILNIMLFFFGLNHSGNSSVKALRTHSIMENCEPKPRVSIMMKKKTDHSGATGIFDSASGYTMKARPGPETAKHAAPLLSVFIA